jgi:large subunit ribosomal protein L33
MCCDECGSRNYQASRNYKARISSSDKPLRLEMKKHCPKCNKHTLHKESK